MENQAICGNCRWHVCVNDEWVCGNPDSDYVTDYTDYKDWCSDWEGRDE